MSYIDRILKRLDNYEKLLTEILNFQRQKQLNISSNNSDISLFFEDKNTKDFYKSEIDYWTGLINYREMTLVIIFCNNKHDTIDYSNSIVCGSWDNWNNNYPLHYTDVGWMIYINDLNIKKGKHHYKIMTADCKWIEPSEYSLREKDCGGNWNNVIFVHD